jgi:hypothetical protein
VTLDADLGVHRCLLCGPTASYDPGELGYVDCDACAGAGLLENMTRCHACAGAGLVRGTTP